MSKFTMKFPPAFPKSIQNPFRILNLESEPLLKFHDYIIGLASSNTSFGSD
jgi:hypothetical protein